MLRPNGQRYHPRTLAGLPDVEVLRTLRAGGVPVLLYGPPGTGKTSLIEAAFDDLITLAGDGDTTVADLIGEYTQDPAGGYRFQYGPLVTAMTEGRALLIDDATLISPKVLAALYPAMDGRRQIQVKAHTGETITAKDGFYVIAGHNPGVHGAILTEALASRFSVQIQVGSDYDLAAALKIDPRAVRIARHLAARHLTGDLGWAPQLRELIAFQKVADLLGPDTAFANLVGIAPWKTATSSPKSSPKPSAAPSPPRPRPPTLTPPRDQVRHPRPRARPTTRPLQGS
ncbi:AAA family ATPase [Streptacidiphilus monticola]